MDFLKIRKKAKERGGAATASPDVDPAPVSAPVPAPAPIAVPDAAAAPTCPPEPPSPAAVSPEPPPREASPEPPAAPDPRFTTWRPGTGQRPFADPSDAAAVSSRFVDPAAPDPARLRKVTPEVPRAPGPAVAAPARVAIPTPAVVPPPTAPPPAAAPAPRAGPRDPLDEFFYREDEQVPALAGLPAEAEPAPPPEAEDAGIEEYLTFRLGVEEYAVAIERVREVLKWQPITEVPRAPPGILGVVTVRGDVVAVFDPRRRLGLPGAPPADGSGRIVIVDDGAGPCGLLVDAVASVVRLARGSVEPCPQGIGGASAECLAGIGRERSRLFTVLELGALLRPPPARSGRAAHAGA